MGQTLVAQVGIGNTNPQSKLDISASNVTAPANTDGILIPRIDNFPASNPTAAQDGMMVFYTGTARSGKGFYYWDNSITDWVYAVGGADSDWFEIGGTSVPNNINDNIYHSGRIAVGTNNSTDGNGNTFRVNIEDGGSDFGGLAITSTQGLSALRVETTGTFSGGGVSTGLSLRSETTGTRNKINFYNTLAGSGAGMTAQRNWFIPGSNYTSETGIRNDLDGNSSGEKYGIYNDISGSGTGNKYGSYNYILTSAGGTHYGVYSNTLKSGSYSGYFLGDVYVGTNTSNGYTLPAIDGTANQIIATDGAGQLSFIDTPDNQTIDQLTLSGTTLQLSLEDDGEAPQTVDLSSLTGEDHDWYVSTTTNRPTSINDDIYTYGNVAIGKANVAYKLDVYENNNTASRALNINKTDNSSSFTYGIYVSKQGLGTDRSHGIYTDITGSGAHQKYGTFNRINSSATGSQYGTRNWISGNTPSNQFGTFNNLDNNGTGDVYGVYNGMRVTNSSNAFGVYNEFLTANSSTNIMAGVRNRFTNGAPGADGFSGVFTDFSLTGSGTYYGVRNEYSASSSGSGTKYGSYNLIPAAAGGTHYGIYSQATKSNSYSGYFLGRLYVGTNTTNGYILPTTDGSTNQVLATNGAGQLVFTNATNTVNAINGLSEAGNNIQLGGTLTQDTAITFGNFDTRFNLNGTGDFIIQDAGNGKFTVLDNGDTVFGGDQYWRDENTGGVIMAQMLDDGDDARFILRENGVISVDMDTNSQFIFNEQGYDRNFRIESNNNPNMFLVDASTDRIGLNTNTPDSKLDIETNSNGTVAHAELTETSANDGGRIKFNNSAEVDNHWTLFGRADNNEADARFNLYFSSVAGGSGENIITVTGNGQVGIRDGAPTYALELPNNAAVTTGRARANAWVTYSDNRVKKHQKPLQYGLKSLLDLTPKSYVQHNSTFENNQLILDYKTGKPSIGFIAQELYKYIPEIVYKPENENEDLWSVDYEKLIPITVKAIQELKEEVDTLAKENQQLKEQLKQFQNLEARLSALENTLNPINETVEVKNSKE